MPPRPKLLQIRTSKCAQSKDLLLAVRSSIPTFSQSPKTRFSRAPGRYKFHRRARREEAGGVPFRWEDRRFQDLRVFSACEPDGARDRSPGTLAVLRASVDVWPRLNNETLGKLDISLHFRPLAYLGQSAVKADTIAKFSQNHGVRWRPRMPALAPARAIPVATH